MDMRRQQVDALERDIDELRRRQDRIVDEQERNINDLRRRQNQIGQCISFWLIIAIIAAILALVVSSSSLQQDVIDLQSKQQQMWSLLHTTQVYQNTTIVVMTDFEKHKRDNDTWFSEPFYTHPHGYKMRLGVDAGGNGYGESIHVSVYVYLLRGEFDDYLEWPFRGNITIQLLNQLEDNDHCTETIPFTDETDDDCAGRVTTGERDAGWGVHAFISHEELDKPNGAKYLEKNCLLFRVFSGETTMVSQMGV